MDEGKFISGLRFVADVISTNFEILPRYEIISPVAGAKATDIHQERNSPVKKQRTVEGKAKSQGVKRTCGHSHKSVRMEHKK